MGIYAIRMPDIGEGIAEAELVEWMVKPGDEVREDDPLAAVMTDKATVEIPSSVTGRVISLGGDVGTLIAVGSELIRLEVAGEGNLDTAAEPALASASAALPRAEAATEPAPVAGPSKAPLPAKPALAAANATPARPAPSGAPRPEGQKPLASPAVRERAREAGIDLRRVHGSGPAGRITHEDLDRYFAGGSDAPGPAAGRPNTEVTEVKVIGLRRKIAERMSLANRNIPHISSVEEIDVTAIEELRAKLNTDKSRTKLTMLPFLMRAMVRTVADLPVCNALYDDEAGIVRRFGGVHIGIATQTPSGLIVPVVRHAEAASLWQNADEILRLSQAARDGSATREELSGSTITLTSLGALGGIVFTPIINHPEVAIVGVNKMAVRPHWDGSTFVPRKMMNLSCSFDHRIVDGYDAAMFLSRMKELLENPALLFLEA